MGGLTVTEKEFSNQVWRPLDIVALDNGIKGRVINVCFPTNSVRIRMPEGPAEWFKCDLIVEHKSITNEPDDISVIEKLHKKLMDAENRIERLVEINAQLEEKAKKNITGELITNVNIIKSSLQEKKKRIEKMEKCMGDIEQLMQKIGEAI